MEKLADCALPELGLDAHSRQLLDFGPRQFELLGEQLQTRLRELVDGLNLSLGWQGAGSQVAMTA